SSDLAVVGADLDELVDVLRVEADEVDLLGGGQLHDAGGGGAGDDEGGVDAAVLQALDAVVEVLVDGADVVLGEVIGAEHVDGVEVHAGADGADGDGLAGQVADGLYLGVEGDDLHLL